MMMSAKTLQIICINNHHFLEETQSERGWGSFLSLTVDLTHKIMSQVFAMSLFRVMWPTEEKIFILSFTSVNFPFSVCWRSKLINWWWLYYSPYWLALIRINLTVFSFAGAVCCAFEQSCICFYICVCVCLWVCVLLYTFLWLCVCVCLCLGCHPEGYLRGGSIVRWQPCPMMPSKTSSCPSNHGSLDNWRFTHIHTYG